jgi:hypothetical protein
MEAMMLKRKALLGMLVMVGLVVGLAIGVRKERAVGAHTMQIQDLRPPASESEDRNAAAASGAFTYHSLDSNYKFCTAVAAADIDSNGWMDILVAGEDGLGSIRWWQNFGNTSLIIQPFISAGYGGATALFGRDLDNDGDTDVAMVSKHTHRLATFEQESDKSWTRVAPMSGAYPANALASTDVKPGAHSHLLVGVSGSNSGVYRVPFWSHIYLADRVASADHPSVVHLEDIDRDGDEDYVFADFYQGGIRWQERNPGGSTQAYAVARSFTRAVWLGTADLDRDGDPDIVAASDTHGLVWWANDGSGNVWTEHVITKREFYRGSSLVLADLDADGDMDIVAGTDRQLIWQENLGHPEGANNWIRHVVDTSPYTSGFGYAVAVADVDRDGRLDIVGCDVENGPGSTTGRRLGWWENVHQAVPAAGVAFMGRTIDSTLTGAWGVDLADFNGDGRLDVAASGYGAGGINGETRVYTGTPGLPWTWAKLFSASFDKGRGLTAYQAGNARPTYVVSGEAYTGEAREFWSSNWDWTASGQAARATGLGTTYQSAVGDLNDDGVMDVVGTSASTDDIVWWNGQTGTQTTIDDNCAGARAVCLGDVDDDGLVDVGAACTNENNLIWLRQTGNASVPWDRFVSTVSFSGATDIACGDVDGDSRADLVAAQPGGEIGMMSYRASGDTGIFIWQWVTQAFTGTEHLALGDIDRDGDLDIAATSASRQEIAWFENTGTGFSDPYVVDESVGTVREIAIGDISGDGAPDLVVASQSRNLVRWYEQQVRTDVTVDKYVDPSSATVISTGQSISYVLDVTNNGFAAPVRVVDRWEPPDAVVAASSDEACVTDVGHGVMTCTLSMDNGQIKDMRVVLTPGLLFDGLLTNTAQVLPVGPFWNNPTGPVTDTAVPVEVQQDMAIWDGQINLGNLPGTPLFPGQSFTYDVGVMNLGPKSGVSATMTSLWSPASAVGGFTIVSATASTLHADAASYTCQNWGPEDGVLCDFANLAVGVPLTVTIGVTTSEQFEGLLEADMYLTDPEGDEGNPTGNRTWPARVGSQPWKTVYLPLTLRQ